MNGTGPVSRHRYDLVGRNKVALKTTALSISHHHTRPGRTDPGHCRQVLLRFNGLDGLYHRHRCRQFSHRLGRGATTSHCNSKTHQQPGCRRDHQQRHPDPGANAVPTGHAVGQTRPPHEQAQADQHGHGRRRKRDQPCQIRNERPMDLSRQDQCSGDGTMPRHFPCRNIEDSGAQSGPCDFEGPFIAAVGQNLGLPLRIYGLKQFGAARRAQIIGPARNAIQQRLEARCSVPASGGSDLG